MTDRMHNFAEYAQKRYSWTFSSRSKNSIRNKVLGHYQDVHGSQTNWLSSFLLSPVSFQRCALYIVAVLVLSTGVYAAVAPVSFQQTASDLKVGFQTAIKGGLENVQTANYAKPDALTSDLAGNPVKTIALETTGDTELDIAADKPLLDVATKKHPLDEQAAVIKRTKELMTISSGKQQDKKEVVDASIDLVGWVASTLLGTPLKADLKDKDEKEKTDKKKDETDSPPLSGILDDTELPDLVDEELVQDGEEIVDTVTDVVDPLVSDLPVVPETVETITETVNSLLP